MVTVLGADGFRVVIYPNDHRPAHVHVIKAGHEAVFNLHCPEVRENYGFSRRDLQRVIDLLTTELSNLCHRWSGIHGTP